MRLRLYVFDPLGNNKIFDTVTESLLMVGWVGLGAGTHGSGLNGLSLTDSNLYRLSVYILDRPACDITC